MLQGSPFSDIGAKTGLLSSLFVEQFNSAASVVTVGFSPELVINTGLK